MVTHAQGRPPDRRRREGPRPGARGGRHRRHDRPRARVEARIGRRPAPRPEEDQRGRERSQTALEPRVPEHAEPRPSPGSVRPSGATLSPLMAARTDPVRPDDPAAHGPRRGTARRDPRPGPHDDRKGRREIENDLDWGIRATTFEIDGRGDSSYHLFQITAPSELLETVRRHAADHRRGRAPPDHQGPARHAAAARGSPRAGRRRVLIRLSADFAATSAPPGRRAGPIRGTTGQRWLAHNQDRAVRVDFVTLLATEEAVGQRQRVDEMRRRNGQAPRREGKMGP